MKIISLLILLIFSPLLIADADIGFLDINTIELNHRLASEVFPEIQPFLPEDTKAKAYRNLIILKTDPQTFYEIKSLIDKIDKPLQSVKVSVLRTDASLSDLHGQSTSVNVKADEGGIPDNILINNWSTRNANEQEQHYQAQGISGRPITINMGKGIRQKEQLTLFNQFTDVIALGDRSYYIDIGNGFQTITHILPDDKVQVEIHPFFGQFSTVSGVIEQSQLITTITGPISQWIELGQINNEKSIEKHGMKSYNNRHNQQQNLFLKVELIL